MAVIGKKGQAVQQHCNFSLGFFPAGKKGQISIEFILIITIALIYINVSVWPTIEASSQSAIEIKAVADTKIATMKLAGALNEAFLSSGDMKKTIGLYLPEGAKITCTSGESSIGYEVQILTLRGISGGGFNPDEEQCEDLLGEAVPPEPPPIIGWTCSSSVALLESLPQGCASTDIGGSLEGPIYREMVVEKEDDGVPATPDISFKWKS